VAIQVYNYNADGVDQQVDLAAVNSKSLAIVYLTNAD
jgi:hypothetical protein